MKTEEELLNAALEETERLLAENPSRYGDPTLPVYQFEARQRLRVMETAFERGDRGALMAAIRLCANHDLVMPSWISRGFIKGYDAVLNGRAASWDDAFGRPYKKGTHLQSLRTKRLLRFQVFNMVQRIRDAESVPIDEGLFERVGRRLGICKTLASDLYYEAQRMIPSRLPRKRRNSREY